MPLVVREIKSDGKTKGFQAGTEGKNYSVSKYGKEGAGSKALSQLRAIQLSKARRSGKSWAPLEK